MNLVISMVRIFNPMNEELKNLWIVKMTKSRAWLEPLAIPSVRHCDDISNWSAFAEQRKTHETPTFFPGHVLVCWEGHLSPKCFSSSTQSYHIQWFNMYYISLLLHKLLVKLKPITCKMNEPYWYRTVCTFRHNYPFLATELVDWCRYVPLEWFGGWRGIFSDVFTGLNWHTASTYVFLRF